jgi:excisionase family DNA binding protein
VRAVPDERFMTLKEVAEYLHLNERTVYKWAQEGTIPGSKLGSTWRFRRSEIDLWVEKHKNIPPDAQEEE